MASSFQRKLIWLQYKIPSLWGFALEIKARFSFVWSFTKLRSSYVVEQWRGGRDLADAKKIAIFVHYDRHGLVHDFVLFYLQSIVAAGFEILFITNSPQFDSAARAKVAPLCGLIVRRKNYGYDFGAYKDGVGLLEDPASLDALLFANDSVYGPFHDLTAILKRTEDERAAVWGITDSWQHVYHLQTYFVLFKKAALLNPAFKKFWRKIRYVQAKTWIVEKYEIGLTRAMMRGGLRCAALYPFRQAMAAVSDAVRSNGGLDVKDVNSKKASYLSNLLLAVDEGTPLNTSHFLWDHLIGAMGCPFLKRELLQLNPAKVPFVNHWDSVITGASKYDADLILRHLEMALRDRFV